MSAKKPSRRQLLGGFLAGLFAWLRPRPARASGQARLRARLLVLVPLAPPTCFSSVTIYDAAGRRTMTWQEPPLELPLPAAPERLEGTTSYSYD